MRHKLRGVAISVFMVFVLAGTAVWAQEAETADKTLSPYFFVKGGESDLDVLPLKSTSAKVNIAGVIADVTVTQVYKNEGNKPIEAVYIFPASTKAAVYGMKMTIGERTIVANIRRNDQARREYEEAKQQGRSASLLEQQRPNVFQMNVANILPGDVINVELSYTELLVPTDGVYEMVYPAVVGPRYSNKPAVEAPASEQWVANPYLHQGESPTYSFDVTVSLAAGLPIQDLTCPSHKVDVAYDGPSLAAIKLDKSEKHGGNRDFILRYRLAGGKIESGLLLSRGEKENFFLLMVQPPKRVTPDQIPAREYIFIVDVSGSMHGFPLDISKKLLRDLIGNLRPVDTFNVLLFAGSSSVLSPQSQPATPENIRRAIGVIENQSGGGGTELLPALKRALSLPKAKGCSRTVVIATDGYVTVEEEAFDLIRGGLGKANMFAFGIGSSVNRHIIEGMARAGMGEPFVITKPEEAEKTAERFRKLIESPVLTDIRVDLGKLAAYDVEPISIPDVMAERPVIVFGKWRGRPQGKLTLEGVSGTKRFVQEIDMNSVRPEKANSGLRYLWARHRIATLSDYNKLRGDDKRIKEVTELGLAYNLLTAYTSFVAVDTQVRLTHGQSTTVKQPLPLPQGVSDYAVGGKSCGQFAALAPGLSSVRACEKGVVGEEVQQCKDKLRRVKPDGAETKQQVVRVRLEKIVVDGDLAREAVKKVLEGQISSIEHCIRQGSARKPGPKAKMVITLTTDGTGKVTGVRLASGAFNDRNLESCILRAMQQVHFPKPGNGSKATITIHMTVEG